MRYTSTLRVPACALAIVLALAFAGIEPALAAVIKSPYGCPISTGCTKYGQAAIWWEQSSSTERVSSFRYRGSLGLPNANECAGVIAGDDDGIYVWLREWLSVYQLSNNQLLDSTDRPGGYVGYQNCTLSDGGSVRAYDRLIQASGGLNVFMVNEYLHQGSSGTDFLITFRWTVNQGSAVSYGGYA